MKPHFELYGAPRRPIAFRETRGGRAATRAFKPAALARDRRMPNPSFTEGGTW